MGSIRHTMLMKENSMKKEVDNEVETASFE